MSRHLANCTILPTGLTSELRLEAPHMRLQPIKSRPDTSAASARFPPFRTRSRYNSGRALHSETRDPGEPMRKILIVLLAATGSAVAQQQTLHAGEYAQADIQYGSSVYASQCTTCHGPNGDQISAVDLRS